MMSKRDKTAAVFDFVGTVDYSHFSRACTFRHLEHVAVFCHKLGGNVIHQDIDDLCTKVKILKFCHFRFKYYVLYHRYITSAV